MPLQADRPLLQPAAVARVGVDGPVVGPIDLLHAVNPGGDVPPVRRHRHREPLAVFRGVRPGRHAAVDRPGAVVDRRRLDLECLVLGPFPKRGADSRLRDYPIRGGKA